MADKNLLILERSTTNLSTSEADDGSIVLEGVFTQFGVKNKNNRIYEEAEVLPHIKELQEKVKTKKLLGELDHPKDFDISLSNVSHVIEDLSYDSANKQVKGRIKLLNTSKGKEAQALIKDGIPLHISSRAAGTVGEDNKVKIKKFFTYDLVADPGFENAELGRVNESFGFDQDDSLFIYEIDKPIYKVQENKSEKMEQSYVTNEDFNKYTEYLKNEINSLKESSTSADNEKMEKLVKYAETIAEKVNGVTEYVDYLAENVDKGITYSNYLAENMNSIKNYAGYLAEQLDSGIRYSEHIAEKTDQSIEFSNYLAESLDKGIKYSEYVGEKVDQNIAYSEYLRENLDKGIKYSEYIAEQVNTEYDKALMEKTETVESTESINEEAKTASYQSTLTESIDNLIKNAEAKSTSDMIFMNFLTESKKREFGALTTEMKDTVVTKMNEGHVMSNLDANRIWESCFIVEEAAADFIKDMPATYKEKWNGLSEARKNQIVAESKFYPLTNAYQINNFWSTRDLRETQVVMEKLNEGVTPAVPTHNAYAVDETRKAEIINNLKFKLNR